MRRLDPRPDVPSSIRRSPAPVAPPPLLQEEETPAPPSSAPPPPDPPPQSPRPIIAPLTPERYRVQFTVTKETRDKLRRVQNLLCREIPGGDPAAIFERALDLLL